MPSNLSPTDLHAKFARRHGPAMLRVIDPRDPSQLAEHEHAAYMANLRGTHRYLVTFRPSVAEMDEELKHERAAGEEMARLQARGEWPPPATAEDFDLLDEHGEPVQVEPVAPTVEPMATAREAETSAPAREAEEGAEDGEPPPGSPLDPYYLAGLDGHLIPLHRWDYVDQKGKQRGKSPRDDNWRNLAYSAQDLIDNQMAGGGTGFRIPADWIILDVDPRNMPEGRDVFAELCLLYGIAPALYPTVRTGAKQPGLHLYGLGRGIPHNGLDGFPGIEFKALGRQMVAPGSRHPDGGDRYEWLPGCVELKDAPAWPAELLNALVKPVLGRQANAGKGAGQGGHDGGESTGADQGDQGGADEGLAPDGRVFTARELGQMLGHLQVTDWRDYDRFMNLLFACHEATRGKADSRDVFVKFCGGDPEYPTSEHGATIRAKWKGARIKPGGVTRLFLFKAIGPQNVPPPPPTEDANGRPLLREPHINDDGNARRFAFDHRDRAMYVGDLKAWHVWDGKRWVLDLDGIRTRALAAESAHVTFKVGRPVSDAGYKYRNTSLSAERLSAAVKLATSRLLVPVADLDEPTFLLNVENGILDVRTGDITPHDPARRLTKLAPTTWDPDARCSIFEETLAWSKLDPATLLALQKILGTGLVRGQALKAFLLMVGAPDSGKSTILKAALAALGNDSRAAAGAVCGSYATSTSFGTFAKHGPRGEANTPMLARLMGVRLVVVNEIPAGGSIAGSILKEWTGGDLVSAVSKYGHPFSYYPDGLVTLVGNEMPDMDTSDDALWNRAVVIRFKHSIPKADQVDNIIEKINPAAVLAWLVRGYQMFAKDGLVLPESCLIERTKARADQDPLASLWAEIEDSSQSFMTYGALWDRYLACASNDRTPSREQMKRPEFKRKVLAKLGEMKSISAGLGWPGKRLRIHASD